MIPLCRHILTSGLVCSQAAIHGTLFCRHHQIVKTTLAEGQRPVAYEAPPQLPFVYPEDRAAIQLDLTLVLLALNDGKIDSRTANSMNRLLNSCAANLAKGPLVEEDRANTVQRVILTLEGDEIALPREVLEKGEALVHGAECPCRVCAEEFRNAPPEQHHPDCKCGLCEDSPSRHTRFAPETGAHESSDLGAEEASGQRSAISVQEATGASGQRSAISDQGTRAQGTGLRAQETSDPALTARAAAAGKLSHQPIELDPPTDDHSDDRATGGKHERRYKHIIDEFERNRETTPPADDFPDIRAMGRKHEQRYQHVLEEIEKNRETARQSWNKQHPDQPIEHTPYLTWGQKQDLKIAQMKKLQQEDEQRQREAVAAGS
jgi:hypothetical protein